MPNIIKNVFICITFLFIFSCSKSVTKSKNNSIYSEYIQSNQLAHVKNIRTFRFQSWHSLDYKHLIISSSQRKSYLISLDFYCNDLLHTPNIQLDQTMASTLSAKFDSIIVPRNNPQIKCRIKSIYPITKEQKNELTGLRKNPQ